jgi:hypothetical protein
VKVVLKPFNGVTLTNDSRIFVVAIPASKVSVLEISMLGL